VDNLVNLDLGLAWLGSGGQPGRSGSWLGLALVDLVSWLGSGGQPGRSGSWLGLAWLGSGGSGVLAWPWWITC
jgi:hypothetical protein